MKFMQLKTWRLFALQPVCIRALPNASLRIAVATAVFAGCALLSTAPTRAAEASCTSAAVRSAAPIGITIGDITDLTPVLPKTNGGVADIPAGFFGTGSPEECLITGSVVTNPASGKTANFGAVLPLHSTWNHKFMFEGCGGDCGTVSLAPTADVLTKGYPVWATDDGHMAANAAWSLISPGVPNDDAIVDFAYRAVHTVVSSGKQLTLNYFGAKRFADSYYEGCSDGGREGIMEVNRYPNDFDGVMAGDPYFDVPGTNLSIANVTAQLQLRNAQISPAQMSIASQIVTAQCDSADGVKDGLIQNPALCHFNPIRDLPECRKGVPGPRCFTLGQREALWNMLAAMTDSRGTVVHPGFPVSALPNSPGFNLAFFFAISTPPSNLTGPEPWPNYVGAPGAWALFPADPGLKYWAYLDLPGYNSLRTLGFTYTRSGPGPINVFHTVTPLSTIEQVYRTMDIASSEYPRDIEPFLAMNKKLLLYHGYSDGGITPYQTIQYYAAIAALTRGFGPLQKNVRLFMVPGMYHCQGGPGPFNFGQYGITPASIDALHDATTALEAWVERGTAPKAFVATKFVNDTPAMGTARTMPLCPFPAAASYRGGNVATASSWSCGERNASLFRVGYDGYEAGLLARIYEPPLLR